MINFLFKYTTGILVNHSKRSQKKQGNANLSAWGLEQKGDQLVVDGCPATELIERYGSPLLVLNESRVDYDIQSIKKAFTCAPSGSKIQFSYKTNCIPGIIRCIHEREIGAEVISPYEFWLADKLGVPGQKIIYNGVSKTKESLRSAIEKNILSINADSIEELKMLKRLAIEASKKVSVGIRLGLVDESQFGVDLKGGEAEEACKYILEHPRCFNLVNLHLHTVANARNSRSHRYYIKQALGFLLKIKTAYGIEIPYLDIGGGFGVPTSQLMPKFSYAFYRLFGILPKRPSGAAFQVFDDYIRDIVLFIKEFCSAHSLNMPKLIIEPGRVIASRAELLLSRVNSIKRKSNGRMYCMTDVGKFSTAYPCDYEYHDIFVANKLTRAPQELYHIVGRICMAGDFVFKNKLLPSLDSGDVLAIMDAGAYFSSYSSNFGFQRPAIVKVKDGNSQVIRHEETFEHLVSMDTLFGERSKP